MGTEGVGRWVWVWVGKCECDKQGCNVGGCGRWVQVMKRVKEGVERIVVRKRVHSHTHIDILHLLCTSLTLSSNYCTLERSNLEDGFSRSLSRSHDACNTLIAGFFSSTKVSQMSYTTECITWLRIDYSSYLSCTTWTDRCLVHPPLHHWVT